MISIEPYQDDTLFGKQYEAIYRFLLAHADYGYNEQFHWARFDWMMQHPLLEKDYLHKITIFYEEEQIQGVILYDTVYADRSYLIHATNDLRLLEAMVRYLIKNDAPATIRVNRQDTALQQLLKTKGYKQEEVSCTVLEIALAQQFLYTLPQGYWFVDETVPLDLWQYQLVLHRGFNHPSIPEPWDKEQMVISLHDTFYQRIFITDKTNYVAHCGIWYTQGNTAYIEPVVTVPESRKMGLGRAVVYEALNRAKEKGAARAIVLSDKAFYHHLGFMVSSTVDTWNRYMVLDCTDNSASTK